MVESVKAASDVYAPLAGKVSEVNQAVVDDPAARQPRGRRARAGSSASSWPTPAQFDALMDEAGVPGLPGDAVMDALAELAALEARGSLRRPPHRPVRGRHRRDAARGRRGDARRSRGQDRARRDPQPAARSICRRRSTRPARIAELRALAARNARDEVAHRPGLPRHPHAAGDPAQRAGEPRLVHRLHALPGGDRAGAAGGAAQLPDHDLRPDRHADRQRLAARRGDRRRRGGRDGARARQGQVRRGRGRAPTCIRRPAPCWRRGRGRSACELVDFAPGDIAAIGAAKPFAVVLQYPGTTGAIRAAARGDHRGARGGRAGDRRAPIRWRSRC